MSERVLKKIRKNKNVDRRITELSEEKSNKFNLKLFKLGAEIFVLFE